MIIYKIVNEVNGKVYVGKTTQDINKRWQGHITRMRVGDTRYLYNSMRYYGVDNFSIEVIDSAGTLYELNKKEKQYIKELNSTSKEFGYNMTKGGEDNPMDNPDVYNKHKKRMQSPETRKKISETMKRKASRNELFSKEHRQNLSIAARGNKNFGTGDTRSISCHCVIDNEIYNFHSYKDGGLWWYQNHKPFGDNYSATTFRRKINDSLRGKPIKFKNPKTLQEIQINNIVWYKGHHTEGREVIV